MGDGLLGLLGLLAVGRLCLSLLPPGWPGGHGARELAATAAASFLVGLAVLALQASLLQRVAPSVNAWHLLAPWAFVLLVRVLVLPGAMRPRHEPRAEGAGAGPRVLLAVGALGLLMPLVITSVHHRDPEGPFALLAAALGPQTRFPLLAPAAMAVLVVGGLERGRRAPSQRALAFAALAWFPPVAWALAGRGDGSVFVALGLVGAGAGAIAWLRRADRRGLGLAVIGLGAATLLSPAGWASASAAALALAFAPPGPARARIAWGCALAVAAAALARGPATLLPPDEGSLLALTPLALLLTCQATLRMERPEALA